MTADLRAHLAPLYYILCGPLRQSFELCRKISLRALAELCRFSTSCSHSAGTPQDCPPGHTETTSVPPQFSIAIRTMTTWWHCTARYQQDILTCSPSSKLNVNRNWRWKNSQGDHLWSRWLWGRGSQRHRSPEWGAASRWPWGSVAGRHLGSLGELQKCQKKKEDLCLNEIFVRGKKNQASWILTVYFEPRLSLDRARLVARHTLEVPAVAGRHCANYESSIPRHREP